MNVLTEAEAKNLWCPFARVLHVEDNGQGDENCPRTVTAINRTGGLGGPHGGACIASNCMAWRWGHSYKGHAEEFTGNRADLPERGEAFQWLRFGDDLDVAGNGTFRLYNKTGFCGLAGRPE